MIAVRLVVAVSVAIFAVASGVPKGRCAVPSPANDGPIELRCEHSVEPLGLDESRPRFSWRIETRRNGAAQSAYQVLVASNPEKLAQDKGDLWDSGRVTSPHSSNIEYGGIPLKSRQRCWWKVRSWDETGAVGSYSSATNIEMGLLAVSDWQAEWIGGPPAWPGRALYFRTVFRLSAPAKRARLYVSGLGYYEAVINGVKQGDASLEPAISDTTKRVFYRTYDVTSLLRTGENVLGATVGQGWEGTHLLRAQLEIECTNGATVTVASGRRKEFTTWQITPGPFLADSVYDGEIYDARREKPGWDRPGFSFATVRDRAENYVGPYLARGPAGTMQAEPLEPIKVMRELAPVKIAAPNPGIWVVDFGQVHAGWVRLRVRGAAGTTVRLRYGDILRPDGRVDQDNLKTVAATDEYTLNGRGDEDWSPRFTYHGYRYVEIEGWPGTPSAESFRSCVVRSSVADRGSFECSAEILNRIHRLVRATEESNLHGLPTDCSDRNERMGWLNDLSAKGEELIYNYDLLRLFEKFTTDIADAQDAETGAIPDTAPFQGGHLPADPVSVSYLLVPTLLFHHYGDVRVLERHFAGMRRWVDFLSTRAENDIVHYSYWGDWAPPATEAVAGSVGTGALSAKTPGELVSTAFYFYSTQLLAQAARVLKRDDLARHYTEQATRIYAAFNAAFWNDKIGAYGSGNQACNSIALYFQLVPADRRAGVVAALVREVERTQFHLTTGNLATKYLLEVLSAEGRGDVALKIATQTTYPSWGFMMANGATALWERWELLTGNGMNSYNHPMLGSVGAWLYRWVAGLRFAEPRDGTPHLVFEPPSLPSLDYAQASVTTPWGLAAISWRRVGANLDTTVTVPWNCTATLILPGVPARELASGSYTYSVPASVNRD